MRENHKKSILQIMAITLMLILGCLTLVSCTNPEKSIKQRVDKDFAELKENGILEASAEDISPDSVEDAHEAVLDLSGALGDFEYTIDEVKLADNKESATVTVTITTHNNSCEVTIKCTKQDGKWKTDIADNEEVRNAIWGGFQGTSE